MLYSLSIIHNKLTSFTQAIWCYPLQPVFLKKGHRAVLYWPPGSGNIWHHHLNDLGGINIYLFCKKTHSYPWTSTGEAMCS